MVQDTDKAMTGVTADYDQNNYKCVSKLAREALRDYISVSGKPQNKPSTDAAGQLRSSAKAGGKSRESKPAAFLNESNGAFLSRQSPAIPEIAGALKTNPRAMDDVVLQLALEQQQAKKQEEEQQIRLLHLLGHLPNSTLQAAALRSTAEAQGEAQGKAFPTELVASGGHSGPNRSQAGIDHFLLLAEQAELKQNQERQFLSAYSRHQANKAQASKEASAAQAQKNEANLANRGGGQDYANALEALQRMQGGGPPLEDVLVQLMNQRSLPLERVMQMVKQREAQSKNAPPPYGLHTPSLARAPWNTASPGGKGGNDRFGMTAPPSEYNKELLRQFQALSSMQPPTHPLQHPTLPAMVHSVHPNNQAERFVQARSLGGGGPSSGIGTSMQRSRTTTRTQRINCDDPFFFEQPHQHHTTLFLKLLEMMS